MADPELALWAMGGVIGGLALLAALILGGGVIVRRLRLNQDPPEAARYDPPAPPLLPRGDPLRAAAQAAVQDLRRAAYGAAFATWRAHQECLELVGAAEAAGGPPEALAAIRQGATAAAAALERAEQAMRDPDPDAAVAAAGVQRDAAEAGRAAARAAAAALPVRRDRTLLWLLLLLALVGAWVLVLAAVGGTGGLGGLGGLGGRMR